jgi:DsbC/DsbD-like thiol-disulfide interchange protein
MSALRGLTLFLALLLLAPAPAHSQKYQGRELVESRLLADVSSITPGQPFTAGLLLKMVPGWHTYWQFPRRRRHPDRDQMATTARLESRPDPVAGSPEAE